jgi:hypothetical protein
LFLYHPNNIEPIKIPQRKWLTFETVI